MVTENSMLMVSVIALTLSRPAALDIAEELTQIELWREVIASGERSCSRLQALWEIISLPSGAVWGSMSLISTSRRYVAKEADHTASGKMKMNLTGSSRRPDKDEGQPQLYRSGSSITFY